MRLTEDFYMDDWNEAYYALLPSISLTMFNTNQAYYLL
jgi:hypothetical protein